MTDRALFFLAGLVCVIAGLGAAIWLAAAEQLGTFDGNFLFLIALLVAGVFALYLKYLISAAREAPPPKNVEKKAETPTREMVGKS